MEELKKEDAEKTAKSLADIEAHISKLHANKDGELKRRKLHRAVEQIQKAVRLSKLLVRSASPFTLRVRALNSMWTSFSKGIITSAEMLTIRKAVAFTRLLTVRPRLNILIIPD